MKLLRFVAERNLLSPILPRGKLAEQVGKARLASYTSTVNQSEVDHHAKIGDSWWDSAGVLCALHSMNHVRVPFIVDGLANVRGEPVNDSSPLKGLKIMDVGCGGGILSEPLARAGAEVTGIDASENLIGIAKKHAASDPSIADKINYVKTAIEDFAPANEATFDAVVASEVLEHVDNRKAFVENCVRALKPGGSIFITTINKTFLSWLAVVILAENIFRAVPMGTHHYDKFVTPGEVQRMLQEYDCTTKLIHGMMYDYMRNSWSWVRFPEINYALHAVKSNRQS